MDPCPDCLEEAAALRRGLSVLCAACGARRPWIDGLPFAPPRPAVEIAAQIALGAAWAALVGFPLAGLAVALMIESLAPGTVAGWLLGAAFIALGLAVGASLLRDEAELRAAALAGPRRARRGEVLALAARRQGLLSATDVVAALGVSRDTAERWLDEVAAREGARVAIEIDDDGRAWFVFADLRPAP